MLQNAYFLAKIGADTAENEQHFAEILPKIGNYPTGPNASERREAPRLVELHLGQLSCLLGRGCVPMVLKLSA